jgi:hypothetical protein
MEIKDFVRVLKAVENLSSGTTFTMSNDDFDSIEWKSNGNLPPTLNELFAEIERLKQDELTIIENAKTAKQAAEAKLAALGLTADDLKALGLG